MTGNTHSDVRRGYDKTLNAERHQRMSYRPATSTESVREVWFPKESIFLQFPAVDLRPYSIGNLFRNGSVDALCYSAYLALEPAVRAVTRQ